MIKNIYICCNRPVFQIRPTFPPLSRSSKKHSCQYMYVHLYIEKTLLLQMVKAWHFNRKRLLYKQTVITFIASLSLPIICPPYLSWKWKCHICNFLRSYISRQKWQRPTENLHLNHSTNDNNTTK